MSEIQGQGLGSENTLMDLRFCPFLLSPPPFPCFWNSASSIQRAQDGLGLVRRIERGRAQYRIQLWPPDLSWESWMGVAKEATFRGTRGDHPHSGPCPRSLSREPVLREELQDKALFPTQDVGKELSLQSGLPHPIRWPEIQARACGGSSCLGSGGLEGHEAEP